MPSTFEFKELKEVAKEVRFKDDKKLPAFKTQMEKLEKAVLNNNKKDYDAAIKDIKEMTKKLTNGYHFKDFNQKLEQLVSKVKSRGTVFTDIVVETNIDEREEVEGGRQESSKSESASSRRRVPIQKEANKEQPSESNSKERDKDLTECLLGLEKLIKKIQAACEEHAVEENKDKKSSAGGAREKKSIIVQRFDRVNEEADRMIGHLEMIRDMKNVKRKAKEKQVQAASENKAMMKMVADWLDKFKKQIDSDKIDVKVFQKVKVEGHEENLIKTNLEDICVKVKSMRETNKSLTDDNERYVKEVRQQKEAIKKTWTEEFSDQNTEPKDAISSLNDLENRIKERKRQLNDLTSVQEKLKSEIAFMKDDIAHFGDLVEPTIEKTAKEEPEILKDIRNVRKQLNERKREKSKETANRKSDNSGAQVQHHVNALWKETFNSEPDMKERKGGIQSMLEKITSKVKELKDLQVKLKMAIQSLSNEVVNFDDLVESSFAKANSPQPEILDDILNVRKQLNIKKKTVAKEAKDREADKNKGMAELKEKVASLSKVVFGTVTELWPDKDDNGLASSLVNMLSKIATEIRQFEKISFELECSCHKIHEKLFGAPSRKKDGDELNSCTTVLQNTCETIKRCADETKNLVENISELTKEMGIENRQEALSLKCHDMRESITSDESKCMKTILNKTSKLLSIAYSELTAEPFFFTEPDVDYTTITEKIPEWLHPAPMSVKRIRICIQLNKEKRNFVSREQYDRLNEEKVRLYDQVKQLETDKDSAYNRLSKIAGARLTDNNSNIADLSDPNRPTKLAEQYSELYDSPWTDAYETLNKQKDEKECIKFLLGIIVNCYDICGELSRNHQMILRRAVCFPGGDKESTQASKTGKKDNSIFSAVQSKALSELRKQTADLSVDNVKSVIKSDHKEWFDSKGVLEKYTMLCIELCWLMHVQTPPVVIETFTKSGSKFDTNRYRQYTKAGKTVDFVVWPVLLLEEGGAVLCKGVAQGKK